MTGAEIATLTRIVAPIAQTIITEGAKVIITLRENVTQDQLDKSLELSRSANWPKLTFGAPEP